MSRKLPRNPRLRQGLAPINSPASSLWVHWAISLVLAGIVWMIFGQTRGFDFAYFYDDDVYVTDNPVVQNGLTLKGLWWAFTYAGIGHWHPLTWITHMLDCQAYGLWAGGHHLTNVAIQMAAAIGLFLALRSLTGNLWRSAIASAIWAAHPLRVESVAWVAERKDVLSGVLFMLTLGAYAGYARHGGRLRYWMVTGLFALGLLCKSMLVTLPFVLLLLDYWPLRRRETSTQSGQGCKPIGPQLAPLLKEKLPLFALAAGSCAATLFAPEKVLEGDHLSLLIRAQNALVSYGTYLWQTLWPADLTAYYPSSREPLPALTLWGLLGLLAAISALAIGCRRRAPYLLVGWLWFLGTLVPVIGILQLPTYAAHADRYTYLPQIGLCILLVWGLGDLLRRAPKWLLALAAFGWVLALAMAARQQTGYWKESELLWTRAVNCTRDNYVAQSNLGNALLQKGDLEAAISHYQLALNIHPDFAVTHNNLGLALAQKGELEEASAHYQAALKIKPDYAEARNNLANALSQSGQLDPAIAQYQLALNAKPEYSEAHYNLANALLRKGEIESALAHYRQALKITPGYVPACNNLAWILATCQDSRLRNGAEAEELAARAVEQAGAQNAILLCTLAAARAENGHFSEALETAQRAIQIAEAQGNTSLRASLQEHLANYRNNQPVRVDP